MAPRALDTKYAELMNAHPFGIALYQPLLSSQFHPGSVGYFDSAGAWNPIGNVSGSPPLPSTLTAIEASQLVRAPPEQQIWGPKLGKKTRATEIGLEAGLGEIPMLAATGGVAPIDVSACWEFRSAENSGSVLLTSGPVVHERYYHKSPFLNWMKANAKKLAALYPEIKDHGVWVVTSTWATKKASVNCWKDSSKSIKVGFSLKAIEIGEVAPKGSWQHGGGASGWITTQNQDRESSVVFFHGIRFTYVPLFGIKQVKSPSLRGAQAISLWSLTTYDDESPDGNVAGFEVLVDDNFEKVEDPAGDNEEGMEGSAWGGGTSDGEGD